MTNAAGTGRFLEVISRTGASVEQLDAITDGVEPHAITSMCTVFANRRSLACGRLASRRRRFWPG